MTTMDEEPTYALPEKPLYDPFERELRQARACIDFALESYDNKKPVAAMNALTRVTGYLAGADAELLSAMSENETYTANEGDKQ